MKTDKIEVLKQTELFRDLDDVILRVLAGHAVEKSLERNEILFLAGDEAKGLYVVAAGAVRAFRTGADGREQVIHVERAVTTIAEVPVFDNGTYPSTVSAEEPTLVYFLDKQEVFRLSLNHPEIALAATRLLARRLRKCAELVESLSLREVGQRLARLLLEEAEASGLAVVNGVRFKQNLTHNQLAARIGTVREVITRVLYRLQIQGLIIVEGKDVVVPDLELLANYADSEKR
ncbi:MAG TPA: Crp/Fnr family transcriptional regulator [Pyrinomonadaceae bacterium]